MTQYLLGFLAGGLSLLAPCVLPLIPLVVTSSLKSSKWGPAMSASGMVFSFTVFGVLTSLFSQFFNPEVIQNFGAVVLILAGIFMLSPYLKEKLSEVFSGVGNLGTSLQGIFQKDSLWKEFIGGSLLGMIWSPCTGPTLAMAVALASQSEELIRSTLIFFHFGLGAGLALLLIAFSMKRFIFLKQFLRKTGNTLNKVAATFSLLLGLFILSGLQGDFEEFVLGVMPDWLIQLSVVL